MACNVLDLSMIRKKIISGCDPFVILYFAIDFEDGQSWTKLCEKYIDCSLSGPLLILG